MQMSDKKAHNLKSGSQPSNECKQCRKAKEVEIVKYELTAYLQARDTVKTTSGIIISDK